MAIVESTQIKGMQIQETTSYHLPSLGKRASFYVADFYCGLKKLVIELDGKLHQFPDQKEYDNARDKLMQEFGMKILRIKNDELKNRTKVLKKIEEVVC